MVIKEDKQRLHRLLADAIPLLCKSGLPLKAPFCIEALIGITLEDDEVLLISFKEEIRADETVSQLQGTSNETGNGDEEKDTTKRVLEPHCPATGKQQTSQFMNGIVEENTNRNEAEDSIPQRERDSLVWDSIPDIKLEVVDVKMEEDVEMISAAGNSRCEPKIRASHVAWNSCEYVNQAASVTIRVDDVERHPEEDVKTQGKGNSNGNETRPCVKTNRRKNPRPTCSNSYSILSKECSYKPTDGSTGDRNKKQKDARSAAIATVSHHSSSLSLINDTVLDCRSSESVTEAQGPVVESLPMDDRVTLEQTSKILSSYRFMSGDDNLYSCHICEAKLRGRQTLYEHIRGTHLCAHIYRCPNCGLSFKWRSGLQRHRYRCTVGTSAQGQVALVDT